LIRFRAKARANFFEKIEKRGLQIPADCAIIHKLSIEDMRD